MISAFSLLCYSNEPQVQRRTWPAFPDCPLCPEELAIHKQLPPSHIHCQPSPTKGFVFDRPSPLRSLSAGAISWLVGDGWPSAQKLSLPQVGPSTSLVKLTRFFWVGSSQFHHCIFVAIAGNTLLLPHRQVLQSITTTDTAETTVLLFYTKCFCNPLSADQSSKQFTSTWNPNANNMNPNQQHKATAVKSKPESTAAKREEGEAKPRPQSNQWQDLVPLNTHVGFHRQSRWAQPFPPGAEKVAIRGLAVLPREGVMKPGMLLTTEETLGPVITSYPTYGVDIHIGGHAQKQIQQVGSRVAWGQTDATTSK